MFFTIVASNTFRRYSVIQSYRFWFTHFLVIVGYISSRVSSETVPSGRIYQEMEIDGR